MLIIAGAAALLRALGLQRGGGCPGGGGVPHTRHLRRGARNRFYHLRFRRGFARAHSLRRRRIGGAGSAAANPPGGSAGAECPTAVAAGVQDAAKRLEAVRAKRCLSTPLFYVEEQAMRLDYITKAFVSAAQMQTARADRRLAAAASKLDALSPLKVLSRGYAIGYRADGRVVKSTADGRPRRLSGLAPLRRQHPLHRGRGARTRGRHIRKDGSHGYRMDF